MLYTSNVSAEIFFAAAIQWPVHGPEKPSTIFPLHMTIPDLFYVNPWYLYVIIMMQIYWMGFSAALWVFALIHIWPTDKFKLISKLGLRAASTGLKKERERQIEGKSRMDSLSYWNICPSISVRAENPSAPLRKKTRGWTALKCK